VQPPGEHINAAAGAAAVKAQVAYEPPEVQVLGALRELTWQEIPETGGGELGPNIAGRK
jgi:hypothetical protein